MPTNKHNQTCIKKVMFLLNSILTILVLEIVGAVEFAVVKPIIKAADPTQLNADEDIIVKISPDAIFKSFQAVVSSDYLRNLAEDFAEKAAAHFMTIVKGAEDKTFRQDISQTNTKANLTIPPVTKKKGKHVVTKEEVLVLLREPAIDGDNLETALSEEITEPTEGNTVRLKINGAYYKRHNLVVKPDLTSTKEPNTTKMREPAIDRDNLETALSEEITETTEGNTVRLKINGAYYKRHNLVVKPDLTSTKEPKTTKMREPAIDRDNLETALSEKITETTEGNTVRLKINGAYYKRHNLVVKPNLTSTKEPKTTKMLEALMTTDTKTEKPKWTTQIPTK